MGCLANFMIKIWNMLRHRNYYLTNRIQLERPCSWICDVEKILGKRGTSVFKQSKCLFLRNITFSQNPNKCCVTQSIKGKKNNCFAHAQHESRGRCLAFQKLVLLKYLTIGFHPRVILYDSIYREGCNKCLVLPGMRHLLWRWMV